MIYLRVRVLATAFVRKRTRLQHAKRVVHRKKVPKETFLILMVPDAHVVGYQNGTPNRRSVTVGAAIRRPRADNIRPYKHKIARVRNGFMPFRMVC